MKRWKTTDWEFMSETVPHFRVHVIRFPIEDGEDHEVKVHVPEELPADPATLREWAEVLEAAAQQLEFWQGATGQLVPEEEG